MSLFDSDTPAVRQSFYLKGPHARVTTARRCRGADKCVSETQGAHLYTTYTASVTPLLTEITHVIFFSIIKALVYMYLYLYTVDVYVNIYVYMYVCMCQV